MSYIKNVLHGRSKNSQINEFLEKEGFEWKSNPFRSQPCWRYVECQTYTVWFCVHDTFIEVVQEWDCGGTVAEMIYEFEEGNFDEFLEEYKDAVDWMTRHLT